MQSEIDHGSFNRWLQSCLRALVAPSLTVDGVIGPGSRAALERFKQCAHELLPEGGELDLDELVGPSTIRALELCTGTRYVPRGVEQPNPSDVMAWTSTDPRAVARPVTDGPDHDVRALTPEDNRRPARPWSQITGITLHQTGMYRFSARAWPKVKAHMGVHHDGSVYWIHPLESRLPASNGFNRDTVAIEVAGNFLRNEDDPRSYWKMGGGPSTLAPEMVEGLRRAIRFITAEVERHGGRITNIHAHRQTNRNKASCPGEAIWKAGGVWAQRELGLSDGGPGYVRGDGLPIPPYWDERLPAPRSVAAFEEPEVDDFEPELDAEFPDDERELLLPGSRRHRGVRIRCVPAGLRRVESPTARAASRELHLAGTDDPLIGSLTETGLELLGELELDLEPSGVGVPRGPSSSQSLELEAPLGPDETALVLLERDGVYSWAHPRVCVSEVGPIPRGTRRAAVLQLCVADLGLGEEGPAQGPTTRGSGSGCWSGRLRAFVFAVAKLVLDEIVECIDPRDSDRLVHVGEEALSQWIERDDPESLVAHLDRPPRILMLIHGTFSSTRGGFGALATTNDGEPLRRMLSSYDLILGFDHRTLSRSPVDNAKALATMLLERRWPAQPTIDVIAHSRGALVARSLVEQQLPGTSLGGAVRSVVLVGPTNGGTELARPENWHRFVDLVTTLTVNGVRALSLMSGIGVNASLIGGPILRGVGCLVKAMASTALTIDYVPGLAAMVPGSQLVCRLNDDTAATTPSAARYYLASAAFDPAGDGRGHPNHRLSDRALAWITDKVTTELYGGVESDLVVDNCSSRALPRRVVVEDALHFASNAFVHHLNFFEQPRLIEQLADWLELRPTVALTSGPPASHHQADGEPLVSTRP